MYNSRMELLGIAVKRDRRALGLSQRTVDWNASRIAQKFSVTLTTNWCGQIERCVKRAVSTNERKLLAFCLEQPQDRYFELTTDPRTAIGALLAKDSKVTD